MNGRMGGAFGTRSRRSAPALRRDARPQDLRNRLSAYAGLMLFVPLVLLGRLWVLQVVRGEEYAREAQSNHLKQREIPAPRGSIYDADGHRLAEVRASFDVMRKVGHMPQEDFPEETAKFAAAFFESEGKVSALGSVRLGKIGKDDDYDR